MPVSVACLFCVVCSLIQYLNRCNPPSSPPRSSSEMASEQLPKIKHRGAHVDADTVFSNYQVRVVPAIAVYQQCPCRCCFPALASWQCLATKTDGQALPS
jgi:hypothetical protein